MQGKNFIKVTREAIGKGIGKGLGTVKTILEARGLSDITIIIIFFEIFLIQHGEIIIQSLLK